MSTHERATVRVPPGWRLTSGTFSVPEGHGVGEGGRWELPGGERTPEAWAEAWESLWLLHWGGWPEQGRPQPVGVGVSGTLQGVPGWQRGWLLVRGRATFSDEFDSGGAGRKDPKVPVSLLLGNVPLSSRPHTPQGSISGVAGQVCQPPLQARMGSWGSRLAGQGGVEGPCTEAPPHTPTKEVLCAPSKRSESREGL